MPVQVVLVAVVVGLHGPVSFANLFFANKKLTYTAKAKVDVVNGYPVAEQLDVREL